VVRTLAATEHLFRLTDLRRRESKGAPEMLPTALRGSETGDGAFAQNVALELRNGAKYGVEHLTRCGAGIDVFSQRAQRYPPLAQRFGRVEQMAQAPSEAVEFPDNEGIARREIRDRALEPRSRSQRARGGIFVNDGAPRSAQRVELQRCRLLVRRDACVTNQARRAGFDDLGVIRPDQTRSWGFLCARFPGFWARRRNTTDKRGDCNGYRRLGPVLSRV
jgi:hypothetical protein